MISKRTVIRFTVLCSLVCSKVSAQVLATEDAKPLKPGQIHLETTMGFERASDSKEYTWAAMVKYRLTRRLFMFSVEPTFISSIHPDSGVSATGIGDVDATLYLKMVEEKKVLPFMSLAFETKIPTAKNRLIGTGKVDFTPTFVANKTTGNFFTSINFGYTIIGKPDSVIANNFFSYGVASIFTPKKRSLLFAEIYGNTTAVDPEKNQGRIFPNSTIRENSEFSGGETVFAIGYGYDFQNGWLLSLKVSYNNTKSILMEAGIEWESATKKITKVVKRVKKEAQKE